MTADADNRAPYELTLLSEANGLRRDGIIEGVVRNCGSLAWNERHMVGLRDFRDTAGNPMPHFELRAYMDRRSAAPGEDVHFRFDLAQAHVPARAASCVLDVVEEHVQWLSQLGGSPLELRILGASRLEDWLIALRHVAEAMALPSRRKLQLLTTVLRYVDLGSQAGVRTIRTLLEAGDTGRPYRLPMPDSATIAAALPRREEHRDPRELLLRHYAALIGERVDVGDPEDCARLFTRLIADAGAVFRGASIPLPRKLTTWLGRRALPPAIASTPATRSIVATLGRDGGLDLNPPDGGADLAWRFVTSVLIDRNLTQALLPDAVAGALSRPSLPPASPHAFPLPTRFMERLHSDDRQYQALYALDEDWSRLAFAIDLYMLSLDNETRRALLGAEIRDWLTAPISDELDISVIELALLAMTDRPVPAFDRGETGPDVALLRAATSWLAPGRPQPIAPTLRLIGDLHSPTGLGVNMRMSMAALQGIGVPLEMVDAQQDLIHPGEPPVAGLALSRPIDLFHLNLDAVPALVCRYAVAARRDAYRIAFALWEGSAMPEQHRAGLELVDEIWTPTEYVAAIYRTAGHPNVHVVGKGIVLPPVPPFDLRSLDIPPGVTTFLLSFDMDSWIDRKNPIAGVRAFERAFRGDPDVRLIVKNNGLYPHFGDRTNHARRLEAAADADPRIILLSEMLPWPRYLGLIAAVDATVSPHRAEGFGYFPAYSLLLGTPSIVTDYSGTRDFCTAETSYPVRAGLVPIGPGEFVFDAAQATWADVDVDALAEAMAQVRADPAEAGRRAAHGRKMVAERYSMDALARRYAERLSAVR